MANQDDGPGKYMCLQYVPDGAGAPRASVVPQPMKTEFGHLYDERLAALWRRNTERLAGGEITTVTLYREQLDMTDVELGMRTGLGKRAVRKHETPAGFMKATIGDLQSYAKVFGVPLAAMFCLIDDSAAQAIAIEESPSGAVSIIKSAKGK